MCEKQLTVISGFSSIILPQSKVVFKWDDENQGTMSGEETAGQLRVQEYLDDVSELDIPPSHTQWYNVDVASLLTATKILGHEVDKFTGDSLLFLERSAMLCSPSSGKMQHFPKHLLHCFVDDNREKCSEHDGVIFRAELFSISPTEEQLCWEHCCRSEMEVPEIQSRVASWLSWLNS